MAVGLPTPKSREQLLSDMLTEYVGITGINDLNTGSAMTQFFDVVARSIARTSGDVFQILRDFSADRATGEALNRIGDEERVPRRTSQVSSGLVKVTDSNFDKISTKIYSGSPAPNIGTTTIKLSDASLFPATGRLYIGRGTSNIEGPINYNAVAQVGAFWEVTLDSPTSKFHNISESVVLGQGGTRNIPVNSIVIVPGTGATADVSYSISSAAILLDGENENPAVEVVAQEPGSLGNAPIGTIREFVTAPFTGAVVINDSPFTNGADSESDDDYRDRIKKERLSKGLGTALAVKNSVLGAQAADEDARITSNEIDTTNVEQTTLYIDTGEGYEEKSEGVGFEFVVDSAIGGERNFQLSAGGTQTSVAKAFLESTEFAPFAVNTLDRLAILVGGVVSEHIFQAGAFQAEGSATAYEIVASINDNSNLTFEATTAENGTKVVIRAKTEDNEFLQLSTPSSGTDAGPKIGFPANEVATVLLYKNRELLNKNGRSAFVLTKGQFDWNSTITDGDTLIISIDGTDEITYTILDTDFLSEGQHSIVNNQNSLSSWVNVLNNKITGITAEINGDKIKITSNLGASNRASIAINPTSDLVSKGMFLSTDLNATGNEADFEISRNTSQIKLNTPLESGDSLTLGSVLTRAEIKSTPILGGQATLSDTGYMWLLIDDTDATAVSVGITAETFLNVSTPGGDIVRYTSTSPTAFSNVQIGDYVIIWSNELSVGNRLEGRVNAVSATVLDLKVTNGEVSAATPEGPILFGEGFTVIRSKKTPQKIRLDAGVYNINTVAAIFDEQIDNATVSIENDEIFIFRTNTESLEGGVFLIDFTDSLKNLGITKNTQSEGVNSQRAFYETGFTDRQFPEFIHGTVNAEQFADAPNSFINTVGSSQDLNALGVDPSGFLCFRQPYGSINDVYSTECVEIQDYTGSVVNIEDSHFYRRGRVSDRFQVINGYNFGPEDSLVTVLDNDPTGKTFDMPLFRTAIANNTLLPDTNNFRAYDKEGGSVEFTEFFGNSFEFDNYKVLMKAKNVIDPSNGGLTVEDAILYRSSEWGRSGEKVGVGYFYPTSPNRGISHVVSTNELVNIKIFLKSGDARITTTDGTTEWNITVTPAVGHDLVTYAYSGTGTTPGLGTIIAGDYVSITTTGEFDPANIGAFKINSATATSFTVKRETGAAVTQSNVANLETGTISFFESEDTTALEIVDYTTANISNYITATIVDDTGLTGDGIIDDSTEEDLDFSNKYVYLVDGKNYILSSDLDAPALSPQFVFKNPLSLPTFDTTTVEAYSFNSGEEIKIIPITSLHVTKFLNILAVTGYTTLGEVKSIVRNTNLQISTNSLGTAGSVKVVGGTASAANAAIEGAAIALGSQDNLKSIVTIVSATSVGFFSDQWVKVFATEIQKKITSIGNQNSIEISASTPEIGKSKIEIFGKNIEQRIFGRKKYHTRTRGRTFKVEEAGQFTCISWDENGTEPFFIKNSVDVKDAASSTLTLLTDTIKGIVDISVDTGLMRFDEVNLGDLVTIQNRPNPENNGSFLVIGRSSDAKTLRISNINGVNELAAGTFTITNNTDVLLDVFTVGANTLTEGTDFIAGVDANETASNLAAVISLIPNITATSTLNVVNVTSDLTNVTVLTSVTGTGATADQAQLIAPISNTGDLVVQSEVQEGDNVIIGSDFNILNRGVFRLIRRFNNSIYIDNQNAVEEEVTLADQLVTFNGDGTTGYNIDKLDGINRLKWNGTGTEPVLEDIRPGDIVTLGTDFNALNQGSFHVVDAGTKLQKIITLTMSRGVDMTSGQYATINSAEDVTNYYLWFNIAAAGGDPAPGGTSMEVAVATLDTAAEVATKVADEINLTYSADFTAVANGDDVVITTTGYGETADAANVDIAGDFLVVTNQDGRRNFTDYINVNGISETGVVVADVLEFHKEAIQFKEYDGVLPGDTFTVSNNFLGENNVGSFVVSDVLSESEIIVNNVLVSVDKVLLDLNSNKVYIEEANPYVGYKKIEYVATNPSNLNNKNIVFDSVNQFGKINKNAGVSMSAVSKMSFPSVAVRGVDSYRFNTGLIAEANRIIYGDPRDNTTYPGVSAAGAEIFIKAPLVRRIQVSVNIRIKTGVPFTTIVEEVRNSIASLINSNDVGKPIPISDIISTVNDIGGIEAVAISSPAYDAQNDVIKVNSGEKALVLDIVSDVLVSKID